MNTSVKATKLVVVELNVYEDMFPLVCGYLQVSAQQDPQIKKAVEFESYVATRQDAIPQILDELVALQADIYAFSCYVWNMGVVKALLPELARRMPLVRFVLGGPQVMNHAERYVVPELPETVVCNGEGEIVFTNILRQMISEQPDYASINGITFRDETGNFVTTETEARISDLDEIPSPFLSNLFTGDYRMTVLETNRGCPYSCGFCYWGAANNSRIHKFNEDRLRAEITWLSEHGVPIISLADANWGIYKRDVQLAEHMVSCKTANRHPVAVLFSAAKNKPERVAEITKRFAASGMISTQPISLQSLDENTLEQVDRKNIKLSNFAELQSDLNERGLGSYIEMIWPLPGETLTSFKAGIADLCDRDAATIIVYAHMLLHNTPIYRDRDRHGIVTVLAEEEAAEAEMVVQTNDAPTADYHAGLQYIYAMTSLYNCRTLQTLGKYLQLNNILGYQELFDGFTNYLHQHPNFAITKFCQDSIDTNSFYLFTNFPTLYHHVMHENRDELAALIKGWAQQQPWWQDQYAQFLLELDMVIRPMLYRDTPLEHTRFTFEHLEVVASSNKDRTYEVRIAGEFVELTRLYMPQGQTLPESRHGLIMQIDHSKGQYNYNPSLPVDKAADYRNAILTRVATVLPTVTANEAAPAGLSIRGASRQLISLGKSIKARRSQV